MKKLLSLALIFWSFTAVAGKVDTLAIRSQAMNKDIATVVIVPQNYYAAVAAGKKYPVLYLLHGYSGNHAYWIKAAPFLATKADELEMIIVCPNGQNSWYFDAPQNPALRFETFVANELVTYIDKNFATIPDRSGRAITGLSMGGHGALYLATRHQEVYGAAGSMAGGVDFRPFPENWEIKTALGTIKNNPENWRINTVVHQVENLKPGKLDLIIDCGQEDFFFEVNQQLHKKLNELKIPHDYTVRPGEHNGEYWTNAIRYQLVFFADYFSKRIR
ncbi:alpha/beta hydrolase [Gynurincola endophyticus]|uniref:alpha/beta hydrolase n=1 Tax=Gynurincola endophyticus TaxID=2479004 RepID=UPI000F8DF200|nr:alpha/beta hydrolase family protein [Gynurincola endophyticus]